MSVVLPVRDRRASVGTAAASVLGQTYRHLELVVVDDGSTDGSANEVLALGDDRVRVVRLEGHRGIAVARNAGLRAARGELVAFQDSDDEWLPTKLARQLELLDARGAGAVGGRYVVASRTVPIAMVAPALEAGADYEGDLLDGAGCITPVWLFRRRVLDELGGFDEDLPCLEDWDLLLRASVTTRLASVAEPVLIKGAGTASLGANVELRRLAMGRIADRHGARWRRRPGDDATLCMELAYLNLAQGHPAVAARVLAGGVRRWAVGADDLREVASAWRRTRGGGVPLWPTRGRTEDDLR